MLVYGDRSKTIAGAEQLCVIRRLLDGARNAPPGLGRHAELVSALIEAGRLLQGVADSGESTDELDVFLLRLARAVVRSMDSGFADTGELPTVPDLILQPSLELRVPEGFAFYAVYPEAYARAVRRLRLSAAPRVIGIRSIGTTLGAIAAAALNAPPPITVRPFGDPFARQVELPAGKVDREAHYVIVDEGPGLSGSSFGCVADALQERGLPLDRIAFIPSHSGDLGPQASDAHRERWSRAQRLAAEFDSSFLEQQFGRLDELASGSPWARRKYLAEHEGRRVLLKFAGLGAIGERKLTMARRLHDTGFTPEPLALVHGFLVEQWCDDARPLARDDKPLTEIGDYIGTRARMFPADPESGASINDLLTMCRRNLSLSLGDDAARSVEPWGASHLCGRVVRVRTDNKLDRCEWLRAAGGRLIKTDALDHHCGHDLIGCQDVAWDIAGAIAEFDLDAEQSALLVARVERASARRVDPELLGFSLLAYCCFRLGQATLAVEMCGDDPATVGEVQRCASQLRNLLHQHDRSRTRQDSSVD